jgi:hypothetical protein
MLQKNVASQFIYFQGVDSSTGGIKSGVTWTVRRCIDGTFAAGGGTVTEDGTTGWYKYALSQADTNGNNLGFNFTGTGAVPQTINVITTAANPTDAVRFGLTALPNAAAEAAGGLYTRGTGAGQIAQDANGNVRVNVDTIKTNAVVNAGTITFPTNATLASTTNITAAAGCAVSSIGANVITAAATAADFGTEIATAIWTDTTAGDFTVALSIGKSIMNGVTLGTGLTVNTVTNAVTLPSIPAGWITAAGIATDAIDADALATDAIDEIWEYATASIGTAGGIGKLIKDNLDVAVSTRGTGTALDAAGVRSAVGLASANLDTQLSTIAGYIDTEVATILAAVDTEVAAIKAKTDSLTFTVAGVLDANIQYVNDVQVNGIGTEGSPWGP